ncbi:MAG: CocE/NonD family hydrolase [Acidimicrobiia bacterium]|nr:CocE/NonD family hydrolase [Acidimicrobiia bacterium]
MKRVLLVCLAALLVGLPLATVRLPHAKAAAPQVRETGYITVRDGTLLKYTVVRPAGTGPFPTLFTYDGYDAGSNPDPGYVAQYVPEGYAFIGVSLRGTGCSGGVWDFFQPAEATDGVDVIRWIAAQSWSDGKVAMIGKSYPGITQLFVAEEAAAEGESHLVAIAPGHTYGDIYRDVAFPGGIFNYSFASLWSFVAQPEPSYSAAFSGVTAGDQTCAQNQANRPQNVPKNAFVQALQHQWDDALIRERSPLYEIGSINVPIYTVISWQDEQVGPRSSNWLSSVNPRVPLYATLTNGDHGMYRTTPSLNDLNRYFDHYLKGIDNGYQNTPRLRVWWESGRNGGARAPGWVTSVSQWPPKTKTARWYLDHGAALGTKKGSGLPDPYAYAGPTGQGIQNPKYSGVTSQPDQYLWSVKPAPGTNDAYTSAPLTKDTPVLGSGSLDLWMASTAVDTDLQVTISEVRPDGQEEYVQAGWLRASHRRLDPAQSTATRPYQTQEQSDQEFLSPGTPTFMRVEIFPFGHVFRAGSRIRISIEGPKFLPDLWGFAALPLPATNLVYHDAEHPSSLALPVLPNFSIPAADKSLPACGSVIRQPCRPA